MVKETYLFQYGKDMIMCISEFISHHLMTFDDYPIAYFILCLLCLRLTLCFAKTAERRSFARKKLTGNELGMIP